MTVWSAQGVLLGLRRNNGIFGDRSGVGAADLGPLRDDVGMMIMWSSLGISIIPRHKINRGEHWIGLDCRFIIVSSDGRWRRIVEVGGGGRP